MMDRGDMLEFLEEDGAVWQYRQADDTPVRDGKLFLNLIQKTVTIVKRKDGSYVRSLGSSVIEEYSSPWPTSYKKGQIQQLS